jgi:hypothetical protein
LDSTIADINKFVRTMLPSSKFSDENCSALARKTEGLFEWAAVACRFILDASHRGEDQLDCFQKIMSTSRDTDDSEKPSKDPSSHYDSIYKTILSQIKDVKLAVSVMTQMVTVFEPLPCPALQELRKHGYSGRSDRGNEVIRILKPLGSLIRGAFDHSVPVAAFHTSFVDFLRDPIRSKKYSILESSCHTELALGSFRVMNNPQRGLRFNICQLETSYLPNSQQPRLDESIRKHISPALRYSCRFGAKHLAQAKVSSKILEELRVFMPVRFVFWLEVLSLLSLVGEASEALSMVLSAVKVSWLIV